MGNPNPIQVPSITSNLEDPRELARFVSSCLQDVAQQFNSLIANKELYGTVGVSGTIGFTGSGNYGVSLVSTGTYWIGFRVPFKISPAAFVTPSTGVTFVIPSVGSTFSGILLNMRDQSSALVNSGFSFLVKGTK